MPKRLICAVVAWTISVFTMVAGIVLDSSAWRGPSILVGLLACVPTFWLIAEHVVKTAQDEVVASVCRAIGYAQAEGRVSRLP